MSAYGLVGFNGVGNNPQFTGDMSAYGLLAGINEGVSDDFKLTGNVCSKGLFVYQPFSLGVGSSVEIGLQDYTYQVEKEDK
jgi:hypothetical protein